MTAPTRTRPTTRPENPPAGEARCPACGRPETAEFHHYGGEGTSGCLPEDGGDTLKPRLR